MARQAPKTFEQGLSEMIRHLDSAQSGNADFNEGSDLLSLCEAVAFQVADLSERQEASITQAIPEAIFGAFGFQRRLATPATGALTFTAPAAVPVPVFIPKGSEVGKEDGTEYVTLEDATLEIAQTSVTVPAAAVVPGKGGNTSAGTVTRMLVPPPGIQGVSNALPFVGGLDAETLEEQRERFAAWIDSLDESSVTGLTNAVMSVNLPGSGSVHEALVVDGQTDGTIPAGTFKVFLYRPGGVPADLLAAITAAVDARRAAGCLPTIAVVAGTSVNVEYVLTVRQNGTTAFARAALEVYFAGLRFGQKASRENILTELKNAHPDILEVTLNAPAADVTVGAQAHLQLGTVTASETVSASGRAE